MAREGLDRKLRAVEAAVSAAMLYDATEEQIADAVQRALTWYDQYQQRLTGKTESSGRHAASAAVAEGSALHRLASAAGLELPAA